jgi:hypothetical protein
MRKLRITAAPIGDLELEFEKQVVTVSGYGSDECGVNCEATVRCEFVGKGDVERLLEALTARRDIEVSFPLTSGQLMVKLKDFQRINWGDIEEESCRLKIRYQNGGIEITWSDSLARVDVLEKLKLAR